MTPLLPLITSAGLADTMAASNDGLVLHITHIAFGDGGSDNGAGYTLSDGMTALVRERARVPVAAGSRLGANEIMVEALLDNGPSFWVREVAFISQTGRAFAVWSHPTIPLAYYSAGVPLAVAYSLALKALPANSVDVQVTGPPVDLTLAEPFAVMATQIVRLQSRGLESDAQSLIATIQNKWS